MEMFEHPEQLEDEILYGNAGYLYCLLLLYQNFEDHRESLTAPIIQVV